MGHMPDNARPFWPRPELLLSSSRAALTFVLLSVFIDSLGYGIIIPSMAPVIMQLTGQPESLAADWNGYLMAVYALLQFFFAPIFGNLSDRIGRRPVLTTWPSTSVAEPAIGPRVADRPSHRSTISTTACSPSPSRQMSAPAAR